MTANHVAQQVLPVMRDPTIHLADLAEALRGSARAQAANSRRAAKVNPAGPKTLDQLADLLETGGSVASAAPVRKPQPRPMSDCSQPFVPWPESWPVPPLEEILADGALRARKPPKSPLCRLLLRCPPTATQLRELRKPKGAK